MTADDFRGRVDELIEAALPPAHDHRAGTLERALALLDADPTIARATIHSASMLGEVGAVEAFLARDGQAAVERGGPRDWDPLLYLCFSSFLRLDAVRAPRMVRVARLLLDHGADPDTHWLDPNEGSGARESALYGAAGVANHVELARMLLEAGADPNDGETPYHAAEHDGVPCAELLFRHGLDELGRSIMVRHKIDYDDLPGVRRLLELGANPNLTSPWGKTGLHQAVFRDRGREWFELLLAHGADPDIRDGAGRTAYALAARTGQRETMEILRAHGADTTLAPVDAFLAACAAGDSAEVTRALASDPGLVEALEPADRAALVEVAAAGNLAGVRTMLDAGFDIGTRGTVWKETATHRAALAGHLDVVRLLVERGADLTLRDASYDSSPLGWAQHGGHPTVLEYLRQDPSRIDLRDAVEHGLVDRARELLEGSDPDAPPGQGGEPGMLLRSAAFHGHAEVVRLLLERGAVAERRNSEGLSALDYAKRAGRLDVVELLRASRPE